MDFTKYTFEKCVTSRDGYLLYTRLFGPVRPVGASGVSSDETGETRTSVHLKRIHTVTTPFDIGVEPGHSLWTDVADERISTSSFVYLCFGVGSHPKLIYGPFRVPVDMPERKYRGISGNTIIG